MRKHVNVSLKIQDAQNLYYHLTNSHEKHPRKALSLTRAKDKLAFQLGKAREINTAIIAGLPPRPDPVITTVTE